MTHRERFLSAVRFERPDAPALEYYYTDVGFAEHGERLAALYRKHPGDTAPVPDMAASELPKPDPRDVDASGDYRRVEEDAWGTVWEYRIFGRIGHAIRFPLASWDRLPDYRIPDMPLEDPAAFRRLAARAASPDGYPVGHGIPGLFERLIALRPFEDVLVDIASGDPRVEELADRLTERFAAESSRAAAAGADFIRIGDDYGTDRALLISPERWRAFFLPRLSRIIEPMKRAGKLCLFHSCGQIWDILPDLRAAGADSIWPQLPLYDYGKLASKLRGLRLALCIHIDRGELMQRGAPEAVWAETDRIHRAFRPDLGGSWYYYEADQGFPFHNLRALAEAIGARRSAVGRD